MALLIGNNQYLHAPPLRNAANDAHALEEALSDLGFTVSKIIDADLRQMERAIDQFVGSLRPGDVAFVHFSGHGIQIDGENYIVPVDFRVTDEASVKYDAYSASKLHDRLAGSPSRLNIVVLDACRNNGFRATRSGGGGLAAMNAAEGSFIAFSTAPGKTADDNPDGDNGLFTSYLLEALRQPGLDLDDTFNRVREQVYAASSKRQLPWTSSSVIGEFVFRENRPAPAPEPSPAAPDVHLTVELAYWDSIKNSANPAAFDAYLAEYPGGKFAALARVRLNELRPSPSPEQEQTAAAPALVATATSPAPPPGPMAMALPPGLSGGTVSPPQPTLPLRESQPAEKPVASPPEPKPQAAPPKTESQASETKPAEAPRQQIAMARPAPIIETAPREVAPGTFAVNPADGLTYVWVPPGDFPMGCLPADSDCDADEKPARPVTLTKGFWMSRTEVTVAADDRCAARTGANLPPAPDFNRDWKDKSQPVVQVTWNEAYAYCAGAGGRLPSEAEWEFAARSGAAAPPSPDLDGHAWHEKNARRGPQPVAGKQPSPWGLHDMQGNVAEWCLDWYAPDSYAASAGVDPAGPSAGRARVLRGGSFQSGSRKHFLTDRDQLLPGMRNRNVGFRCVTRTLP